MPLFRRKSEKLPKTSSLSLYGQGRSQTPPCNSRSISDKRTEFPDENEPPFLTFAEVTYDPSVPVRSRSRLSKTLDDVLRDNGALAYFIQFMEAKKAKHLVKFWLEAESFHSSVTDRLRDFSNSNKKYTSFYSLNTHAEAFDKDSASSTVETSSQEDKNDAVGVMLAESKAGGDQFKKCASIDDSAVSSCQTSLNQTSPSSNNAQDDESRKSADSSPVPDQLLVVSLGKNAVIGGAENLKESCQKSVVNGSQAINVSTESDAAPDTVGELAEEAINLNLNCHGLSLPKPGFVRLHTSIEQDAKAIYNKYIAHGCQFPIGISEELYNRVTDSVMRPGDTVDPECFFPAQQFVVKKMDEDYFPIFLRSSFHCKHQIDVLTSGNVYLADVLYNDSALFYFMEFMEQDNIRHLVDFLLMADNFEKHLNALESYDGEQAQNDAMVIYEKYFSLQATSPLGFSDSIRYEVEHNICRDGGPLPDCFKKPVMILTQYIEKTYLLQFLNSQLYFKYISECIITIQSGGMESENQKTEGSESGSEHSLPVSSVNTLLAMDGKQPGASAKMLKNVEDQDMRIDTGRFKPDSLWRRPLAGKLQIADVDKLGRVITEFEPEPDRRKESRLSKAVKKLVSREYDKNQEEMAWRVAEMIVHDICNLTMPSSSQNSEQNGPS